MQKLIKGPQFSTLVYLPKVPNHKNNQNFTNLEEKLVRKQSTSQISRLKKRRAKGNPTFPVSWIDFIWVDPRNIPSKQSKQPTNLAIPFLRDTLSRGWPFLYDFYHLIWTPGVISFHLPFEDPFLIPLFLESVRLVAPFCHKIQLTFGLWILTPCLLWTAEIFCYLFHLYLCCLDCFMEYPNTWSMV